MTPPEALSWTLVHFLWQGSVIGLVTMAALLVARRPETRYAVGCLGLVAMGAAAIGTFAYLLSGGAVPVVVLMRSEPTKLELVLPWVNRIWAAGTAVLLLRALGGWLVARRRTRRGTGSLSSEWQERAFRLAQRLGVEGRARVLQSVAVTVPMVFGWVKPVVLLPACALSGLTVGQVEALLAHELAHVRRHDYLVNLVQTALESVLFYHPAVWWVSSRVRRERELCCDEAAVEVCGDRVLYSNALLRMEETRIAVAMAANGGSLTERIGRLLGMSENRMGWTPAWVLGGVLMVCMGVVWAKTEQAPPPPPPPPPPAEDRASKAARPAKPPKPPVPPVPPVPADNDATALYLKLQAEMNAADRPRQAQIADRLQLEAETEKAKLDLELVREKEIERRFRYAEERFGRDGVNGVLTDRGRTYVKMGPPDEIESHPGVKEVWRYRSGNRLLEFDGVGKLKK